MMLRWLPVGLWIVAILGLSSIPSLGSSPQPFPGVDKLVHMCEYGILGFLFTRAWRVPTRPAWKVVLSAALFGLLIGCSDELYQMHVPGRTSDPLDALADGIGAGLGGLLAWRRQRRSAAAHELQRSA